MHLGILGFILTITGVHKTLTWSLATDFPFDDIIFREPCFAFCVVLTFVAYYFWKNQDELHSAKFPIQY